MAVPMVATRQDMERLSGVVRDRMARHRLEIQQPVIDLVEKCMDMILKHPAVIRPEWDTDEERKGIIEHVRSEVKAVVIEWLDKEIGSNTITL